MALALLAEGVDTRKYFDPPVHRQRTYEHLEDRRLPVTDAVASSVLSLPVYPDLTDGHVEQVCEIVRAADEHAVELDAVRVDDRRSRRTHVRARLIIFGSGPGTSAGGARSWAGPRPQLVAQRATSSPNAKA